MADHAQECEDLEVQRHAQPSADVVDERAMSSRIDRRKLIQETCRDLKVRLGLQEDSVRNQVEHVEALWESFLTRHPDEPHAALVDLGSQLLRTQREWTAQVWRPLTGDVERSGNLLQEVCLYWLIWGELGNLRYCPEMLCFLVAAARAHCQEAADTTTVDFLGGVVKPMFAVVVSETFVPGDPPKPRYGQAPAPARASNYDDWNELFWDPSRLRSALRLRRAGAPRHVRRNLLLQSTPPAEVWTKLPDVDWEVSLAGKKSHREVHSLVPLLIGCYRVFLLQTVAFALMMCFVVTTAISDHLLQLAAVGLIAPAWMFFYGIGYQILTPSLAWRTRFLSFVTLLVFYMLPVVSYAFVVLHETGVVQVTIPTVVRLGISTREWVLAIHFTVSALVLLCALRPQRPNLYRWRFYPRITLNRAPGATAFWLLAIGITFGMSYVVLRLCGKSIHGLWELHGGTIYMPGSEWLLVIAQLVLLVLPTWLCFVASLPFFSSIVTAIVGAARGVRRLGGMKLIWYRRGVGLTRTPKTLCSRVLQLPRSRPSDFKPLKAFQWWNQMSDRELESFVEVWGTMANELRDRDLLSDAEHQALTFESAAAARQGKVPRLLDPMDVFRLRNSLPANREARRRIVALARSAQMQPLPSGTVRQMPTLSVLIPHYGETILFQRKDLFAEGTNTALLHYLVKYYRDEFANFAERICGPSSTRRPPSPFAGHDGLTADLEVALSKWTSLRMQTLWRTAQGVCHAYSLALETLVRQQEPGVPQEQRDMLVREKLQVVLAVQQYAQFADPASPSYDMSRLAAVEAMLGAFGAWLTIAYIEEQDDPAGKRYFSCMIDASCAYDPSKMVGTSEIGMRQPKFRIELPGYPILGHGKSDNQNCAIVFTRGEVMQMIDANQDAYFESALFLPLALQEMVGASSGKLGGRRPGILGFREHIFSDIGLLGRLAADSEFTFGTIMQRTMDWPLQARLHYGHPDVMDKLQMVQQGGVSKGTRGLNLSEDVFAGLDLVLRGGWTKYQEYFHVGKGRDMGFMSALSFYAKISMGNGEQAITRQWMRMGLELPLQRLIGVFYTHVGFYLNQVLMSCALQVFAFMAAFFTVSQPINMGFADAAVGVCTSYFGILYLLFVAASMLPLLLEVWIEEGIRASLWSAANSFLSLSPVFASFQSKLMGYFFLTTVHYGGAQYIPTGRGLATSREPFAKLFQTFAQTHMHDALDIALLVCFSAGVYYGWPFYVCMAFTVWSWTFAPFLFNPQQFDDGRQAVRDLRALASWLWAAEGNMDKSWPAWHLRLQTMRGSASAATMLLPSARLIAAFCSTILLMELSPVAAFEASWAWTQSLLALLPPVGHLVLCLLIAPCVRYSRCFSPPLVPTHVLLSIAGVSITCYEMSLIQWYSSSALAVIFQKYVTLRFLLQVADDVVAHRPGGAALALVHEAARIWTMSWRLPRDALLGLVLSCMCIFLAYVPCLAKVHALFLFRTRPQGKCSDAPAGEEAEREEEEAALRGLFEAYAQKSHRRGQHGVPVGVWSPQRRLGAGRSRPGPVKA